MLRPNFVRSQVGDVLTFEKHVSQLIATIKESPTVDLSELFFRLTMDSSTVRPAKLSRSNTCSYIT